MSREVKKQLEGHRWVATGIDHFPWLWCVRCNMVKLRNEATEKVRRCVQGE